MPEPIFLDSPVFAITSIYAIPLAFMLVYLSFNVIRNRYRFKCALGDGGHDKLAQAIRAQGNFTEYTPFFLILLALLEANHSSATLVHGLGMVFVLGRSLHLYSLTKAEKYEKGQLKSGVKFRQAGMVMTFGCIITAAIANATQLILAL